MLATGMHNRPLNSKHTQPQRPAPTPGPRTPHDVTSPREEPAKTIPGSASGFGMEKNWAGGKSRLWTRIQIQATSRRGEMTPAQGKQRRPDCPATVPGAEGGLRPGWGVWLQPARRSSTLSRGRDSHRPPTNTRGSCCVCGRFAGSVCERRQPHKRAALSSSSASHTLNPL